MALAVTIAAHPATPKQWQEPNTHPPLNSNLKSEHYSRIIGYNCTMKNLPVNINFKRMAIAFRSHVRQKATQAGSNIIYMKNGQLIEENPKDSTTRIQNKALLSR